MDILENKLIEIQQLINDGLDAKATVRVFELIGGAGMLAGGADISACTNEEQAEILSSFRLWADYMPLADEIPYTDEQRYLHILWECIDRVPLGINCAFAIPFRQMIAKKLFKRCGDGFVANEGCRFNFGNMIEVGTNVSWNAGCYIDAKGGVEFGDHSMLTEYAKIFTHSHSEHNHMQRDYHPVKIGDYAKVYTNATILPGVTLGTGAIVATGAIVTKNVDEFTLVAGIPAKPMRRRNFDGESFDEMQQYMLKDKLFQV